MTRPYDGLAVHYDVAYRHVDYEDDARFLADAFARHGQGELKRVLDLGCGTGTRSLALAASGLHVMGVDLSPRMIDAARAKAEAAPHDVAARVRFEVGDMAEDVPEGPFDAAVSLFGAFNYVRDDARALRMLSRVRDVLATGGIVLVEFWNPAGVRPAQRFDIAEPADGARLYHLIESRFDSASGDYHIRFEAFAVDGDRVRDRSVEEHVLRTRTPEAVRSMVEEAGLEFVQFARGDPNAKSLDAPAEDAMRWVVVGRRGAHHRAQ